MIGGNIPGETMVASVALYRHVEALRFADAHNLALCLLSYLRSAYLFPSSYYSAANKKHHVMQNHFR